MWWRRRRTYILSIAETPTCRGYCELQGKAPSGRGGITKPDPLRPLRTTEPAVCEHQTCKAECFDEGASTCYAADDSLLDYGFVCLNYDVSPNNRKLCCCEDRGEES